MNSIEEKLWNYIDGSCTAEEQQAIAALIEQDDVYRRQYNELLKLNHEFSNMEIDEPSMAFTYNVMEAIGTEHARQPLKAAINKRIVWGIAAFFIITIATLIVVVLGDINWHSGPINVSIPTQIAANATHFNNFFAGPLFKGFLFLDLVAGLFFLDTCLRKKRLSGQ